jgi:hypothetical protein
MFVKEVRKANGAVSIRIMESIRRGGKTVQKTVRTLGQHKDVEEIAIIKKAAEALIVKLMNDEGPFITGFDPSDIHVVKT